MRKAADVTPVQSVFNTILFPGMRCVILLDTARHCAAAKETVSLSDRELAVFAACGTSARDPEPEDLCEIGTLARVAQIKQRPRCERWVAAIEGLHRVRSQRYTRKDPFRQAVVESIVEPSVDPARLHVLSAAIRRAAAEMRSLYRNCQRTEHVILTDHEMPGKNGLWLLEQVRERYPTTRRLLMSAKTPPGIWEHLRAGLVERLLPKPVGRTDALAFLRCSGAIRG